MSNADALAVAVFIAGLFALLFHAWWTVLGALVFLGLEASA